MAIRRPSRVWTAGFAVVFLAISLTACDDDDPHAEGMMEGGAGAESPSAPPSPETSDDVPVDVPDESPDDSAAGAPAVEDCFPGDWQVDQSSDAWQLPAGDADEVTGTFSISFSAGALPRDWTLLMVTHRTSLLRIADSALTLTDGTLAPMEPAHV